jgi:diaminopimelate decarboxylase
MIGSCEGAKDVWPTRLRVESGVVTLGGVSVVEAVAHLQDQPVFLFDADTIRTALTEYRSAFAPFHPAEIGYSVKACTHPEVLRLLRGTPPSLRSLAEARAAADAGLPLEHGWMHLDPSNRHELSAVLALGVRRVVVDGPSDLASLVRLDPAKALVLWVRRGPSLDRADAAGEAERVVALATEICRYPRLRLVGLHTHVGSQLSDLTRFEQAAHALAATARLVRETAGAELQTLCVGGGLAIKLGADAWVPSVAAYASAIVRAVRGDLGTASAEIAIAVEPGRSLVARSAIAVCRVVGQTHAAGRRCVVIRVSGDSELARLLRAERHEMLVLRDPVRVDGDPADVYAETGESLSMGTMIGDVGEGDLVAIAGVGAYALGRQDRGNVLLIATSDSRTCQD